MSAIKEARQVRNEMTQTATYQAAVNEAVQQQMNLIERAIADGRTHVVFSVPRAYETEVKRLFIEKGYTFLPTGYYGGVWQQSEDIYW